MAQGLVLDHPCPWPGSSRALVLEQHSCGGDKASVPGIKAAPKQRFPLQLLWFAALCSTPA